MAYNVSDKYREQIYSGDSLDNELYVEYDNVEVENAPLLTESLNWTRRIIANTSTSFSLDNFVSQTMELIIHDYEVSDTTKEFYFKIGTKIDDEYEYVPLGYYHIKEAPTTTKGKTTYSLTDRSTYFDIYVDLSSYIEEQGGSITKLQAVQKYCESAGVEFANDSFLGSTDSIGIYDNTITARQHIKYIAESAGCIATINRDGKLEFISIVPANDSNTYTIPEKILNIKMENSKGTYTISKVLYEGSLMTYEKGDDTNDTLFINTSNIYISKQEDIDNIYDNINGLSIDNISTSYIIGDPSLDPWDYITYSNTDDEGNVVSTYTSLAQYSLTFGGGFKQSFETSIDADSKKVNSTKNSNSSKYKKLAQEIDTVNATLKVTAEEVGELQKEVTTSSTTIGNPIEITDAGNYQLEKYIKYGKCEQDGTPTTDNPIEIYSCDIWENKLLTTSTDYIDGGTYVSGANSDSYTIEATSTSIYLYNVVEKGETYTEECGPLIPVTSSNYVFYNTGNSSCGFEIVVYDENKTCLGTRSSTHSSGRLRIGYTDTAYISVTFDIATATIGEQYTIAPVVLIGKTLNSYSVDDLEVFGYIPYGKWLITTTLQSSDTTSSIYKQTIDLNIYDTDGNITGNYELCSVGEICDYIEDDTLHKLIGKIDSYNGEEITTNYISTTGELSTGATIYYVLDEEITYTLDYDMLTLYENYNHIYDNDYSTSDMKITYLRDTTLNQQYATKGELKIATDEISLEVSRKVDDEDYTGASIIAKVNDDESSLAFKADKISLEGYTTINDGFSVDEEGNMDCNNATMSNVSISGGNIILMEEDPNIDNGALKIVDPTSYVTRYDTYSITEGKDMSGEYLYFDNIPDTNYITSDSDAGNVLESSGGYSIYHEQYNGTQTEGNIEKVSLKKGENELITFYEYIPNNDRVLNTAPYQLPDDFGTITSISDTCELFSSSIILGASLVEYYNDITYYTKDGMSLVKYLNDDKTEFKSVTVSSDLTEVHHVANSNNFIVNISTEEDDPANDSFAISSNLCTKEILYATASGDVYINNLRVWNEIKIGGGSYVAPYGNIIYMVMMSDSDNNYIEVSSKDYDDVYGISLWLSDKRLKSNIDDTKVNALDTIKQIKHREFTYKTNEDNLIKIGYIADELKEIDEQMVFEVGEEKMKQPQISYIIPLLSKAIQEQQAQIEELQKEIEELKNK